MVLSYDEIAQVLKEPMSIVKNKLYRARLMLRERHLPRGRDFRCELYEDSIMKNLDGEIDDMKITG